MKISFGKIHTAYFFKPNELTLQVMTSKERELITDLKKCNFEKMAVYFKEQGEKRKEMTKEEKAKIKEQKDEEQKIYGMAIIDGHRQKIANFRIEPPGREIEAR